MFSLTSRAASIFQLKFHSAFHILSALAPLLAPLLAPTQAEAQGADLKIAYFESEGYPADWILTGTAFGPGPAHGTLPNQQPVSGMVGTGYINSYHGTDASTGTLELAPFTVQKPLINFLIGGGNKPKETYVELVVDGQVVRTATGYDNEMLYWITWDMRPWSGKTARIRIVDRATGGWGHILADEFSQGDSPKAFLESYRPQFHFTAPNNWINDPNGLVYYAGEYHIFYQHNPYGIQWGNMTWGHAVSPDLLHWQHLPVAITPDNETCTAYSGSAVVDWENTAGFQTGSEKTLIILWTSIGCGQRLAYSNDKGRTWTKWSGNPVIPQEGDARDPRVFWHAPTKKWVLAVWTPERGNGIALYTSPNLKVWTYQSIITGFFECPDLFELALDGDPSKKKWILHAADGRYRMGTFDGVRFTPEGGFYNLDWGRNWYAPQSWNDLPSSDGRRINLAWMRDGQYPGMPFNGQMSLPTELALKNLPEGPRVVRLPIRELERLRIGTETLKDRTLAAGQSVTAGMGGDLLEIHAEFETAGAAEFGLKVRGSTVAYKTANQSLTALERSAPLPPVSGRIKMLVVADRSSLEVFGNDGAVTLSSNYLPAAGSKGVEAYATGGSAKLISLEVHRLRGTWDPRHLEEAWNPKPVSVTPGMERKSQTRTIGGRGWTAALLRRGVFDILGRILPPPVK